MVDPAVYRGISSLGYVPTIGNKSYVDKALLESSGKTTLIDAIGFEGLLTGIAFESLANKKLSTPNPKTVILGIIWNMYSGIVKQTKENIKHNEQVEKAKSK